MKRHFLARRYTNPRLRCLHWRQLPLHCSILDLASDIDRVQTSTRCLTDSSRHAPSMPNFSSTAPKPSTVNPACALASTTFGPRQHSWIARTQQDCTTQTSGRAEYHQRSWTADGARVPMETEQRSSPTETTRTPKTLKSHAKTTSWSTSVRPASPPLILVHPSESIKWIGKHEIQAKASGQYGRNKCHESLPSKHLRYMCLRKFQHKTSIP